MSLTNDQRVEILQQAVRTQCRSFVEYIGESAPPYNIDENEERLIAVFDFGNCIRVFIQLGRVVNTERMLLKSGDRIRCQFRTESYDQRIPLNDLPINSHFQRLGVNLFNRTL